MIAGVMRSKTGMGGQLAWPALLRKLDQQNPATASDRGAARHSTGGLAEAGRTLDFKGFPIRYWEAGQGRPLLLIHGFPSAAWDWHYLWEPLAQRYRVLVCDLLGFGDSAKPRAHRYSLLEQADLQQALLGRLGIDEPLHVLAHDYGDSVAQELLARHHEGRLRLASCVFLNGGLFPETHRPVLSQKLLLSPLGGLFGRLFDRRALARNFAKVRPAQPARRDRAGCLLEPDRKQPGAAGDASPDPLHRRPPRAA